MKTFRWFLLFIAWISLACIRLAAQIGGSDPIESYVARLSARDHFNSSGQRLQSPAAIIRQDRANYYAYGYRDAEDEPDQFFSNKANRARLERLLEGGTTTPEARQLIVNGTPLIRVDVYPNFVNVTILSR